MLVEIWSDVVCPWCYIGKRRFEAALSRFEHRDAVDVVWRSFELDPHAPAERTGDLVSHLARKYRTTTERADAMQDRLRTLGATEGIGFAFERARPGNTFDAHRALHLARASGCQDAAKERLLRAYFTEGRPIGDRSTLTDLIVEVGLDAGELTRLWAGDLYGDEVRADEARAADLDVGGVPYFLFDGRGALPGAQEADVILRVLQRTWEKRVVR